MARNRKLQNLLSAAVLALAMTALIGSADAATRAGHADGVRPGGWPRFYSISRIVHGTFIIKLPIVLYAATPPNGRAGW